ncbi:MAG TPA: PSD1 and planctomycete cytochrome C domain-containing protein, partial [Pirellulaceae bacterium]|nr:PSD1 and planctomycete cytochrome C domain-containing protein [Pirellulaceae bacterium]
MTATGLLLRAACWIKPKTWPRRLARNSTATGVAIRSAFVIGAAVLASGLSARAEEPKSGAEVKSGASTFEHDARPILKKYCLDCHGAGDELKANLDLRLKRLILKGGEAGAAIVPGKPAESLLIHRLKSGEMPPGEKKVTPDEIAKLERWIADGALTSRPEPEMLDQGIGITPEEREFWAFQPLRRITPPTQPAAPATLPGGANADAAAASAAVTEKFAVMRTRLRSPVDAFVASTAAAQQLRFAPEADPRTLASRVLLDLLGLAPNQEQLDEFAAQVAAGEPDAYERLVDRALASPRYGERWGRHWLDIAGYADSDGYTNADSPRPYAYKYRDYVIKALNTDKAFDRFIVEQLAGDELVGGATTNFTPEQIELLTATGFLRMAADGTGSGAPDQDLARNQVMNDTLKIVASTFYGLTLQCAQCHNHRYDPILQSDFYRLRAVFEPAIDWKSWKNPQQRLVSLYTDADRAKSAAIEAEASKIAAEKNEKQAKYMAAALEKELMKHPEGQREALRSAYNTPADKRTPEQQKLLKENPSVNISPGVLYQYDAAAAEDLKKYDQRIAETRAAKPVEDFVQALVEPPGVNPTTFLFYRGDHRQPKGAIQPGDLTIATPPGSRFDIAADDPQLPTTGRRLALAKHMTSGQHPLVGRTLVNRFWMLHFGRGIVGTPSDFGALGERPTHPELLDWLATEWPTRGWSLKQLHRLLLTSTVFRQSAQRDPAAGGRDDDNRYFTRMPVRRLDAEVLRD